MIPTLNSLTPSKHQAAGHDGCLATDSLFIKLTVQQEIDFYTQVQLHDQSVQDAPLGSQLSHWMPTFMGTLTQGDVSKTQQQVWINCHQQKDKQINNTLYY